MNNNENITKFLVSFILYFIQKIIIIIIIKETEWKKSRKKKKNKIYKNVAIFHGCPDSIQINQKSEIPLRVSSPTLYYFIFLFFFVWFVLLYFVGFMWMFEGQSRIKQLRFAFLINILLFFFCFCSIAFNPISIVQKKCIKF